MDNNTSSAEGLVCFKDWDEFIAKAGEFANTISTTPHPKEKIYGFNATANSDLEYLSENTDGNHFIEGAIGGGLIRAKFEYGGKTLNFEAEM